MTDADRYSRQRCLPEVGDAGQARLEGAALVVAAGPAALVELAYLARAGAREVAISRLEPAVPFTHRAHFRHAPSRDFAAGSWRALHKIKSILASP